MQLTQDEIHEALGIAVEKIEAAGASPELTAAVCVVSDLRQAVGNQWNMPDRYAAERVRAMLKPKQPIT